MVFLKGGTCSGPGIPGLDERTLLLAPLRAAFPDGLAKSEGDTQADARLGSERRDGLLYGTDADPRMARGWLPAPAGRVDAPALMSSPSRMGHLILGDKAVRAALS